MLLIELIFVGIYIVVYDASYFFSCILELTAYFLFEAAFFLE